MNRNKVVLVSSLTAAVLGVTGLAALAIPAGAGEQPSLPDVAAQDLLSSVLTAEPPALAGSVRIDNALGLPVIPGMPSQLGNGKSDVRVWFDGDGRSRVSMPSDGGEKIAVYDGTTVWHWDSSTRTATKMTAPADAADHDTELVDPSTVAKDLLAIVEPSSSIAVDGTAMVGERPAYELVLAPKPTERTLLREVRVAVDAETRIPLQLEVLANGTNEPVFAIGFADLEVTAQDGSLFRFDPPAGVTVTEEDISEHGPAGPAGQDRAPLGADDVNVVGDGWDMVMVGTLPEDVFGGGSDGSDDRPEGDRPRPGVGGGIDPHAMLDRLGTKVDGSWGSGYLISTAVASVIVTEDGRVAVGAVPQQVLAEALSR